MPLLQAANIELSYGERSVLDGVSIAVEDGDRVGIVGRNGSGKSTLLRILAGEAKQDAGRVTLAQGRTAGYLTQEPDLDGDRTLREEAASALAHLEALHDELESVFHAMGDAGGEQLERLMKRQESLEARIEASGGYAVDHKIDAVLHGLGLTDERFGVPVAKLSGGQKARLALAKLLLSGPSVLLLDEPTNHLDITGRLWLETFLRDEFRGAVILISHDRALLDGVVSRIVEVEPVPARGGRLIEYPGNYADFRALRADRLETQRRMHEKQQTAFKREEAFIRKYKAGQRAKQARGRESRLERAKAETTVERPVELSTMKLELPKAERTGDIVASVRGLTKRYPGESGEPITLFEDLTVTIERGQRWGVIGPNGAGKTTLVRTILGEIEPDAGAVSLGTRLSIGYFTQTHEHLDPDATVVRYLQSVVRKECPGQQLSEQTARHLAGAFMFSGQDQDKPLGLLSGGERGRAMLAGLLASAKNVLVLDEPTNHLDIPSAERLERALRRGEDGEPGVFDGTLLLISHDRALLDACCDHLLILDGRGGCEVVLGTYSEWAAVRDAQHTRAGAAAPMPPGPRSKAKGTGAPNRGSAAAAAHARTSGNGAGSKWSWMKAEQLERKIETAESELAELDRSLDDPEVWIDHERANALVERRDAVRAELEGLEAEWLRKME